MMDPAKDELESLDEEELERYLSQLRQEVIEAARYDFGVYWNYCWPDTPIARHHLEWFNALRPGDAVPGNHDASDRLLIIAPRSWGKTSYVIKRVLWELGHNPNQYITIVSCDDGHATNILAEIEQNIRLNDRLHDVFPRLLPGDIWQRTQINVMRRVLSKDPSVRAAGLFSTGVGGRSHLLIFDDVVAWRTARGQPALRDQSKQIFHQVWMNYLLPGGRAMSLCTPWHPRDLNMDLKSSGQWTVWERAALIDSLGRPDLNGESSWPEVWSKEELLQKRKLDEVAFEMQYMLRPTALMESVFDYDSILASIVDKVPEGIEDWPMYMGVDVGMRTEGSGSYSAIFVLAVDTTSNTYYTIDVLRSKCTAPELMNYVLDFATRYPNIRKCYIENNAAQQALVDFINMKQIAFDVTGFTTTLRRNDSEIGIPTVAARFKQGKWRIPHDHPEAIASCDCNLCYWIREMAEWPACAYGDTVMAMWLASRAAADSAPTVPGVSLSTPRVYAGSDLEDVDDDEIPDDDGGHRVRSAIARVMDEIFDREEEE